jgi:capsular exopolysaccharide synthesis family protein
MGRLEHEPLDLRHYVKLFRRRGWLLLLCVVLIPVGTYLYTERLDEVYESSAVLQVGSDTSVPGQEDTAPQNLPALAALVSTSIVADDAARVLGEPRGSVRGAATAAVNEDTGFLTITAQGPTSRRAQRIASAFTEALGATRARRARRRVEGAIEDAERELRSLGAAEIGPRQELEAQVRRLRALQSAQAENVQVVERPSAGQKVAPQPRRNATVALILAFLLGIGLMLFAERADRRIRKPEDLERLSGLPLVGTIPRHAFPGGRPSPQTVEAFQTLRDSVTYFNVDRQLKSLMVMSALKGEGKTTVATHLAVAYARAGKRVILVDADLRKPEVADRIGVNGVVGLSQVLAGAKLSGALTEVPVFGSRLRVLSGGAVPPNPSELLGSRRMEGLLSALTKHADIVIFDTPPLLMVSDAFPLLDKVSGILAIARLEQATRDPVRRMLEVAATAGGNVLGVVATGARSAGQYGYGYGYGEGYGYGQQIPADEAARFESRIGQAPDALPTEEPPVYEEPPAQQEPAEAETEPEPAEAESAAAEEPASGDEPEGAQEPEGAEEQPPEEPEAAEGGPPEEPEAAEEGEEADQPIADGRPPAATAAGRELTLVAQVPEPEPSEPEPERIAPLPGFELEHSEPEEVPLRRRRWLRRR